MEARHARPLTAYVGMCAAAVVVLSQSIGPSEAGLADAIAHAGDPVAIVQTVTLSAVAGVAETSSDVAAVVAQAAVPVVLAVTNDRPAATTPGETVHRVMTSHGGQPAPVSSSSSSSETTTGGSSGEPSFRTSGDRAERGHHAKTNRDQRRSEHKTDRDSRRAQHKADRAERKQQQRAARR